MHTKKYACFGFSKPLEDPTPSENILVSVWIPENILVSVWIPENVLRDWDNLPEHERHEIGRQVTYFISMKVAQATPKKEELLRTGD
jgi:ribonucleotide reductase beta subunit family protein with ferritin-like domain